MTMTSGSGTYIGYEPPATKAPLGSEPPRRRKGGWIAVVATALVVGALSGASAAVLIDDEPAAPVVIEVPVAAEPVTPSDTDAPIILGVDPAAVGATVIPSIVTVQVGSTQNGEFVATGSGSGVVFDPSHIITNHHVIAGATEVSVTFADGARFPARVIGSDPVTDIAVLLVDRADLTAVEIGSSASLSIGEPAVAVGNPLGLPGGPTVTSGIISALNRSLNVAGSDFLYGLVQTDAPIAPGSSGGALVDARARLIGITTAIAVSDVGAEGLGFAIPIDWSWRLSPT